VIYNIVNAHIHNKSHTSPEGVKLCRNHGSLSQLKPSGSQDSRTIFLSLRNTGNFSGEFHSKDMTHDAAPPVPTDNSEVNERTGKTITAIR